MTGIGGIIIRIRMGRSRRIQRDLTIRIRRPRLIKGRESQGLDDGHRDHVVGLLGCVSFG